LLKHTLTKRDRERERERGRERAEINGSLKISILLSNLTQHQLDAKLLLHLRYEYKPETYSNCKKQKNFVYLPAY